MSTKIEGLKRGTSGLIHYRYFRIETGIALAFFGADMLLAAELLGISIEGVTLRKMHKYILETDPEAGAGILWRNLNGEVVVDKTPNVLSIPSSDLDPEMLEKIREKDMKALAVAFPDEIFIRGSGQRLV